MYLGLGVLLLQGLQPVALFGQVLDLVLVLRQTALSNLLLVHLLDLQLGVVIPLLQLVIFVLEGLQLVRGLRLLLGGHALFETLVPADLGQSFIKKEPLHLLSQQLDLSGQVTSIVPFFLMSFSSDFFICSGNRFKL